MFEALNPKNYDKVVNAARIASGYNYDGEKTFKTATMALHYKRILSEACLAAKTLVLRHDPALPVTDYSATLKDIKYFRELVNERWRFVMGSLGL